MNRHAKLTKGEIYENKGGGRFICLCDANGEITKLCNVASGWTLYAHVITMYDDGKIEWDFSTGGHFKVG